MDTLEKLKYPTGRFTNPGALTQPERESLVLVMDAFPMVFAETARKFTAPLLDTPYRPDGWTGRQVIHHVADSHMNAYMRLKLALTEDNPTIKPYNENAWSALPDVQEVDISVSLSILESVHCRMISVMRHMMESEWARTFVHPQSGRVFRLDELLSLYCWHGNHHHGHLKLILSV